mgnify:CR=1 FL=1
MLKFKIEIKLVNVVKNKDDYSILGVIDHKEELVKAAPNQQIPTKLIPKDLRSDCHCDHCNISKVRNKTVFIRNEKTGEIIRVGGSCIKYYLGMNYSNVLDYIETLNLFVESYDNKEIDFDNSHFEKIEIESISTKSIIDYFFVYVKLHNYISKSGAERINTTIEDYSKKVTPTSSIIHKNIDTVYDDPRNNYKCSNEDIVNWEKECELFQKLIDKADVNDYNDFVKYIQDNFENNNFLYNVQNMIKTDSVKLNQINYVIGACSMYYGKKLAEEQRNKIIEEKPVSNWVGTIGEKMILTNLKITKISGFETQYGWSNVYKFIDENGNIFTKFGTMSDKFVIKYEVEGELIGATVSFLAEIKDHKTNTFNNISTKETILGRLSQIK